MVKILNGEIVQDDDPRLRQQQQGSPARPGGAGGDGPARGSSGAGPRGPPPAGGGTGFNAGAAPFRFVPPLPGTEAPLGLPDAEVFGVRVTPYALLAVVGLGMVMGWRGVLVACVLYYVYLANQNNPANRPQQPGPQQPGQQQQQQRQQQQGGGGPADFLQRYLNGPAPPPGAGGPGGRAAGSGPVPAGPAGQGGGAGPGGAGEGDSWAAFKGPGRKLGK